MNGEVNQGLSTCQINISSSSALPRHLLKNYQEPIQCYPQVSYRIQPLPLLNQEGNQEMNAGRTHQAPIVLPIF